MTNRLPPNSDDDSEEDVSNANEESEIDLELQLQRRQMLEIKAKAKEIIDLMTKIDSKRSNWDGMLTIDKDIQTLSDLHDSMNQLNKLTTSVMHMLQCNKSVLEIIFLQIQ